MEEMDVFQKTKMTRLIINKDQTFILKLLVNENISTQYDSFSPNQSDRDNLRSSRSI